VVVGELPGLGSRLLILRLLLIMTRQLLEGDHKGHEDHELSGLLSFMKRFFLTKTRAV
jgi:hypothetical protein